VGTLVTLELPVAPTPIWVAGSIVVGTGKKIVVLDDDESVRLLWQDRLTDFDVTYLKDPEEFDINLFPPQQCHYLLDHESIRSKVRGIDLINSNNLGFRAILVTSHFNDPKLQEAVLAAGAKMLPKFLISQVEIIREENRAVPNSIVENPNMVLIDDQYAVHLDWQMGAEEIGKTVLLLKGEDDLRKYKVTFETPIFVDKSLEHEVSGLDVIDRLNKVGYKNLYLCTSGHHLSLKYPSYLKGVIDKDFPAHLFTDSKAQEFNVNGLPFTQISYSNAKSDNGQAYEKPMETK
jgi:hypothetical protein